MTDKSFGDHHNRNVVKNPLLSTAVTGLSIEDLTHNAVLLPVSLSQEAITRPEQTATQTTALGHTEHVVPTHPAGDANSYLNLPPQPSITTINPSDRQNTQKAQANTEISKSTVSKGSVKSDDDFDVNEYFARLHGTRYVSAPLNSALKEDKHPNLEAVEDNLEEINLNEPEKQDVQQSLTADIAQNFSQLPTVLPQVASAVFSSFSNMLQTRKSREPTPDVSSGYQEVQFERPSEPKEVKEVLPPPRDPPREPLGAPPSFSTSNYRLPPKKKYAQIPGLSTGDVAPTPSQQYQSYQTMPPLNQNIPQYFVPSSLSEQHAIGKQNMQDRQNENLTQNISESQSNVPTYSTPEADVAKADTVIETPVNMFDISAQNIPDNQTPLKDNVVGVQSHQMSNPFHTHDTSQSVLPPPPMFANQPRRDSQTGAGKSVLPPSVARRIGANQPIIKQQIPQAPLFTENIFTPASLDTQNAANESEMFVKSSISQSSIADTSVTTNAQISTGLMSSFSSSAAMYSIPSSVPPFSVCKPVGYMNPPLTEARSHPQATGRPAGGQSLDFMQTSVAPPPLFETSTTSLISSLPPSSKPPLSMGSSIVEPIPKDSSASFPLSVISPANTKAATPPSSSSVFLTSKMQASTTMPNIFTPSSNESGSASVQTSVGVSQDSLPQPPIFFNPSAMKAEIKEFPPIDNQTTPTPEAPKSVPEPPKASGNINFRMTKKRPKYYVGPIEGVGAISNNVKPVIPAVDTGSFHGALFTPQQDNAVNQVAQNVNQYSEQIPFDISRTVEPIYSNRSVEPQQNYNTAFDMSRPTTETYNERKQESTGFGLLGSLKSKLGALDINKIQNTVTTFFDPAYNNTRIETLNEQEQVPYGHQQYGQQHYGQTQASNFEIFVPSIEQATPAYDYHYHTPYQTQYNYNQPTEQYDSQVAQNAYQNIGNYFSDADMHRYQDHGNNVRGTSQETPQNEEYRTEKSQEEINAGMQPDIEIQKIYSAQPTHEIHSSQYLMSQQKLPSESSYLQHNITPNVKATEAEPERRNSILVADAADFFNSPTNVVQNLPPINLLSGSSDNASLGFEPLMKNLSDDQQPQSETNMLSNTKTTISQIEACPSNIIISQKSESESALHFFDNPVSQIVQNEPNKQHDSESSVDIQQKLDVDGSFGAAASFFDNTIVGEVQPRKELKDFAFNISHHPVIGQKDIKPESKIDDGSTPMISNLHSNTSDFFSSLNPADAKIQGIFSSAFDYNKSGVLDQEKSEVITDWPEETRPLSMSSAPLFGLSTMLANKTKELHDLEDEIKNLVIEEPAEETSYFESLKNDEDDNKENVSELNICETCREVNKPEDWIRDETDDLTTQLIENITSPIQLSNPVEVPLTEINTPVEDREDFNKSQCEEISHITEETIEAIQVQAATELLEGDQKTRDYGWSTNDIQHADKVERDYTFEQPTGLEQHDYSLPVNPNAIGFLGRNSLFEDIPNKLKVDFEKQDNVTRVLPRQMSIPSAPPAEDDSKSESLDVHSIEQDASKDFPILEEYVIDPDDADERTDVVPQKLDTFSSRVDKYKKKEDEICKTSPTFLTSTSPSLPIASYFDTGNYAADTHYKNSASTPSSTFTFGPNPMSVPPGFEEEFERRNSTQDNFPDNIETFIPETSTQTRHIFSPTFSTAQVSNTCTTTASTISNLRSGGSENHLPDFKNVFGIIRDKKQETIALGRLTNQTMIGSNIESVNLDDSVNSNLQQTNQDSIFGSKQESVMPGASMFKTPEFDLEPQLPDPINFFTSSTETAQSDAHDQSFNRLASYFSSPAKTDHSKSFFELSQSENHYRQEFKGNIEIGTENLTPDIPQQQYVANLNLIRDLTSFQPEIKPEHVLKTVNYFTIEYDNKSLIDELTKHESINKIAHVKFNETKENIVNNVKENEKFDVDPDYAIISTLNTCKRCCNLTIGYVQIYNSVYPDVLKDFKVKKCMDGNNQPKKDNAMDIKGTNLEKKASVTVNFDNITIKDEPNEDVSITSESRTSTEYTPVRHHWFYRVDVDCKSTWRGFSAADSKALEDAFQSPELNDDTVVATDGGRYDVNVKGRIRVAVYWSDKPTNVRRCSWFYKGTTDARYVPYTEPVAEKLEEEYRHGMTTGEWHRRLVLPNNEMVVMHGPAVMVHFLQSQSSDAFSSPPLFAFGKRVYRNPPKIRVTRDQTDKIDHLIMLVHGAGEYRHQREKIQSAMRPRVVRRGHDESEIEEMEPSSIDHLLLLCHGVGSACDMRFRNVEEVVDDFRATSLQLIQSHYKEAYDSGHIGRVEVLPISWHATLHSGETGVDRRLARITLDSIPRLRNFTNDTVLDVLFYTSPVFCQTIINTVCAELNRIYLLFRRRNPKFSGGVSLGGHSLGSVILYDLLCHQVPEGAAPSPDKNFVLGAAGTGQVTVQYPTLDFSPVALYALGSPIAIFECIRGVDSLGADFSLPTCKNFFNVFHPYDPIAYRIEPLINPSLREFKPHLIPHHKGRKRMHLELKDTMARVGADIKQKLVESIKSTWTSMWRAAPPPAAHAHLEKVVEEELEKEPMSESSKEDQTEEPCSEMLGRLNGGRRVDYVLQEAPFEMINEYLFAMSSHVCYWESEDTMLLMLREIYDSMGVRPDNTVPQNSLTVVRARTNNDQTGLLTAAEFPSTSKDNHS